MSKVSQLRQHSRWVMKRSFDCSQWRTVLTRTVVLAPKLERAAKVRMTLDTHMEGRSSPPSNFQVD